MSACARLKNLALLSEFPPSTIIYLLTVFSERHEHGVVGVLLDLVGRRVVGDHGEAGQVRVLRLVAVAVL